MHNEKQRQQLHDIAYDSIKSGLSNGKAMAVDSSKLDTALQTNRATFVTLNKHGQLRGCIGMLEPIRPLAEDVAHNAFAAAFSDPRFPPLKENELEQLDIHISILGTPEKMSFDSEEDLIRQLKPGIDGLIMEEGRRRGTFLPSVWESLAESRDFLHHLKLKSGLPENYWSDDIKIQRYSVEEF
ncbi:MAG: AmmeMemoRadiSam system protein A [Gammaproteobacteria bacterium]|nr:AmmeMemoRadiSam system protein A [Gammaproteobacteria bacterium]